MGETGERGSVRPAIVFAASLAFPLLLAGAAWLGGWWLLLVPAAVWGGSSLLDAVLPVSTRNPDLHQSERAINWHVRLVQLWAPIQIVLIFGAIYAASLPGVFSVGEAVGLMLCVGVGTGTFGVVYAHELMHRPDNFSRWLAELILITVCYGHFMTEHLRVHHRYVGTPRDAATSRYQESLYRFLARVLPGSVGSAWRVEADRLARRGKPVWSEANPFWRYLGGVGLCLVAAASIAGWFGILLFLIQSLVAVILTECINFIQHYGLTRKHMGHGSYEHTREHHSWNAPLPATSALLINLQRHSDHHFKPERPYALLQTYPESKAPRLPYGYPVMVAIAVSPQLWRWVMNRRVRHWRSEHYPDIEDWTPYDRGTLPLPK
jgi:alkane 1-monooxygenase